MICGVAYIESMLIAIEKIVSPRSLQLQNFATLSCKMHDHAQGPQHICCEESQTSHLDDPVPHEPIAIPIAHLRPIHTQQSSSECSAYTSSSSEPASPSTPATDPHIDGSDEASKNETEATTPTTPRKRRASTLLISKSPEDVHRILGDKGEARTRLVEKVCCGGGCCFLNALQEDPSSIPFRPLRFRRTTRFEALVSRWEL